MARLFGAFNCQCPSASVCVPVSAGAYPMSGSACLQKIGLQKIGLQKIGLQKIGPYRIEHQGWWASSYAGAMPKQQGDAR